MTPIRVAIVEDNRSIREGLRFLIGGTEPFQVVGAYGSAEEAVAAIPHCSVDVILMDIGLPGMSGVQAIRAIRAEHPRLQFLVLSVYDDDAQIFEAMCAGACGYLLKKTAPARLLEGIREVAEGGAPMSPEVARKVVDLFRSVRPSPHAGYGLTPHELRLLRLLVEGHNYKTAANHLAVSVNTISFHVRKIYEKLQVHSKSAAVAKALRDGLT